MTTTMTRMMIRKLLIAAVLVVLVVGLAELYGRWVAAESRERVAQIEAEKNERIAQLNAALEVLQQAAAEKRIEVDTLETVRIQHVERATGFLGQAEETATAIEEHLEARGDTAGARMFATYVEERDSAQVSTTAGLLAEQQRTAAALQGWAIAEEERDLEIEKRLAVERANAGLHKEITTLQNKLSPAFVTRLLRTGRDVAIGAGIVTVITVVAK